MTILRIWDLRRGDNDDNRTNSLCSLLSLPLLAALLFWFASLRLWITSLLVDLVSPVNFSKGFGGKNPGNPDTKTGVHSSSLDK
jgi:hypothetical protein